MVNKNVGFTINIKNLTGHQNKSLSKFHCLIKFHLSVERWKIYRNPRLENHCHFFSKVLKHHQNTKTPMITTELKTRIVSELSELRKNFAGSEKDFARSLGINNAQYSRIKKGDHNQVLSEQKWMGLARRLELPIGNDPAWNIAKTPVFEFITEQLRFCQDNSTSRMICDIADIGKTFAAKSYVKANKNAIYVDFSQVKSATGLVRLIAKEFGVGHTGRYSDVYADLVFYLRSLSSPLVVVDEAGDLKKQEFKEMKALWNATERCCAWYMMGADGLKANIVRGIEGKTVGYTEIFSRYGSRYQKPSPDGSDELKRFKTIQAALIIKANLNGKDVDVHKLIVSCDYSLRRIQDELRKIN